MKFAWKLAVLVLLASCRFDFDRIADASLAPGAAVGYPMDGSETSPAVAWDGTQFLVGWLDSHGRPADPSVAGNLVSPSGHIGAPVPWAIDGFIDHERPAIACDPTTGICTIFTGQYDSSSALYRGMVVAGAPTQPSGIIVNHASNWPAVVAFGGQFVLAYTDAIAVNPAGLFAAQVSEAGALAGGPATLEADTHRASLPRIAASSTGCLATWTNEVHELRTAIIESDLMITAPTTLPGMIDTPTVASDGTGYLVAWIESNAVRAVLVDDTGTAGTSFDIAPGSAPAIAWNGSVYQIAFVDPMGAIALATVRADGTLDHVETLIAPGANSEPALGSDGAGTTVLAYVHKDETPYVRAFVLPAG